MAEKFDLSKNFDITLRIREKLGDIILLLNNSSTIIRVEDDKLDKKELKRRLFNILDCLEEVK